MVFSKNSVKKIICFLIFCFLILQIFIHCTYLFRNAGVDARQNILEFYDEDPDSLDVVFIGGSNVYRFWNPMSAWESYGITSYDYSVSAMPAAGTISAIKDVEKYQKPSIVVVDVRTALSDYLPTDISLGARNLWDSQDLNYDRMQGISYYADLNNLPVEEVMPAYIDLINYHDNYEALSDEQHWRWIDNRGVGSVNTREFYKGFSVKAAHTFLEDPADMIHYNKSKLNEKSYRIIMDIIEYCNEKNIRLLLCASPYLTNKENQAELNTIKELAEENGCNFIDTNKYYEEMGIDFEEDFYDEEHVNIVGAEKYTAFMAKYLTENYELADHRGEKKYQTWDELYKEYLPVAESRMEETKQIVSAKCEALKTEEEMKKTEDVAKWFAMAYNENITVLLVLNNKISTGLSVESAFYLKQYGVTESVLREGQFLGAICMASGYNSTGDMKYEYEYYTLSVGDNPQILVGNRNYFPENSDGLVMAVYDNNVGEIMDTVVLHVNDKGDLDLQHLN